MCFATLRTIQLLPRRVCETLLHHTPHHLTESSIPHAIARLLSQTVSETFSLCTSCVVTSSSPLLTRNAHTQSQTLHTRHTTYTSVLSCPVLSCPVLSCPVLSCPVLSCPVLSCPVLSCPVLSCPVLSCPVLSRGKCPEVSCIRKPISCVLKGKALDDSQSLYKYQVFTWTKRVKLVECSLDWSWYTGRNIEIVGLSHQEHLFRRGSPQPTCNRF